MHLSHVSLYLSLPTDMLMAGTGFTESFGTIFHPMGNEIDIERSHPEAGATVANLGPYQQAIDELRELLTPEIGLVESRIIAPVHDFQQIIKQVRKNVTKRDHKLVDYDRTNNSYTKLRDKKEKTLKDEQNLFKAEQDYETAAADYEYYNNTMKEELPVFFEMGKRFMTPLFHSFYYMQLNVFYLTLDKVQTFSDGRYDISAAAAAGIESDYVAQLNDAAERLEALSIRKPAAPSARILQQNRGASGSLGSPSGSVKSAGGGLASGAPSKGGLGRASSTSSGATAAPPAYSTGGAAGPAATGKRAPPPIPGKPASAAPPVSYVIALYDYTAQAAGDLSFAAGDRIEVVERTASTEDWWTGKLNGAQGVFPGNYVRDD